MTNETKNQATEIATIENTVYPVNLAERVVKGADGKYKRKAEYEKFSSVVATTREEKIKLAQLFGGDDETVLQLADLKGKEFYIKDVIFQPYEGVDEETGEIQDGVVTYLFTFEDEKIVTSSKAAYFKLKQQVFSVFGEPTYESLEDAPKIKVVEKKAPTGRKYNDLVLTL